MFRFCSQNCSYSSLNIKCVYILYIRLFIFLRLLKAPYVANRFQAPSLPGCQWRLDERTSPQTSLIMTYVAQRYIQSIDLIVYIFNAADRWVKMPLSAGNKKNPLCSPVQKKNKLVSVYWLKSHHEKRWWNRGESIWYFLWKYAEF